MAEGSRAPSREHHFENVTKNDRDNETDDTIELQRAKRIELETNLNEQESLEMMNLMLDLDKQFEEQLNVLDDELAQKLENAKSPDERQKLLGGFSHSLNRENLI